MKAVKFFLILFCSLLIFLGGRINKNTEIFKEQLYQDSLQVYHNALTRFSNDTSTLQSTLKQTLPPEVVFQNLPSPSTHKSPYLNASQGIGVMIKGLEWDGVDIDSVYPELRTKFNARYIKNFNTLHFDPDFSNCGYPDLHITIPNEPSIFWNDTNGLSKFLRKKVRKEKPLESYYLRTANSTKVRMDLWVAQFQISFRIDPELNHSRNKEIKFDGIHPITKEKSRFLRSSREFKDKRYGNMTLFLELKPKNDNWYIAEKNESGMFIPNGEPIIGIAAIECIEILSIDEKGVNTPHGLIGITIEKGQSLPLYNSLEEVKNQFLGAYKNLNTSQDVETITQPYYGLAESREKSIIINKDLFGKSKYSAIQIKNLGSWKEPHSRFFGKKEFKADLFKAKFLVQLFVLGEWKVKGRPLVEFQLRPPTKVIKKGVLNWLFPNFGLGIFGKSFSFLILGIIVFTFLSLFFQPLAKIIDTVIYIISKSFGGQ